MWEPSLAETKRILLLYNYNLSYKSLFKYSLYHFSIPEWNLLLMELSLKQRAKLLCDCRQHFLYIDCATMRIPLVSERGFCFGYSTNYLSILSTLWLLVSWQFIIQGPYNSMGVWILSFSLLSSEVTIIL